MTGNRSKATPLRTGTYAVAILVLAAALPNVGLAATWDQGTWKVDPSKSFVASGYATLALKRVDSAKATSGPHIVISKGNVYRVVGAGAYDSKDVEVGGAPHGTSGQAVLIGAKAQSKDPCGLQCQMGQANRYMTLSFKAVDGAAQQIDDMLADGGQRP